MTQISFLKFAHLNVSNGLISASFIPKKIGVIFAFNESVINLEIPVDKRD